MSRLLPLLRMLPGPARELLARLLICSWQGHISTSTIARRMCDSCLTTFVPAGPSVYIGEDKVTRSRL